jgi:hypothetical protein
MTFIDTVPEAAAAGDIDARNRATQFPDQLLAPGSSCEREEFSKVLLLLAVTATLGFMAQAAVATSGAHFFLRPAALFSVDQRRGHCR